MIQSAFCDDDQTVLDQLSALLEKYRAQRCVQIQCTAFHSPLDLLAEIEKGTRYDILFLDVIMPAENGITAAKEIRQYDNVVKIIFLTSSAEFAVESYVVGAYFYQLKPIWEDSFFRLTDSMIAECRRADQRSLILRCKTGISRIDLDQLLYCEVLGRTAGHCAVPDKRHRAAGCHRAGRHPAAYYVAGGNHHEVIEKEPDGNLLVLTSSLEGHIEDKIQEIDRQTGEVVNELIMEDIFGGKYEDRVDWTHLNTVSYQPETDTIVISPRNLESVVKLNWTTKEIQWILCDPRFWEGTEYEKYVLQPEGDFVYQFQQHTAYQLETDLDGDDQTIEVSMFDNHYVKVRKSDVLQYFDGEKESYLLVYAVNEAEKTVKQIKKIPTVWSTITSSAIYDADSNHIFGMCGHVKDSEDKRRGMNYEFDYDTEELINQFSIKSYYYRASEMKIDWNDLAAAMEIKDNYIMGELYQPVKATWFFWQKKPEQVLEDGEITLHLTGQVLYAGAYDHQISQIIFHGKKNTYVYDTTDIRLHTKSYLKFYENIPVPLQGMEADDYEIYVVYQNEFYDLEQNIKIK